MSYSTLLFDLDHTLLDSASSELLAFEESLRSVGVGDPMRYFERYSRINRSLWAAVERHELDPDDLRIVRFEQFVEQVGLAVDPIELADAYVAGLGANGELYPESRPVLDRLRGHVNLALVTNGIGEVQRSRIQRLGLDEYFPVVAISGEIGMAKPGRGIFDYTFTALEFPAKEEVLIVGDSLSSDIRGGSDYGIATCWFNPGRKPGNATVSITHEVTTLVEVLSMVGLEP